MKTDYKKCTRCEKWFPATEEYFYKQLVRRKKKGDIHKLTSWCKACTKKNSRKWEIENPEKKRELLKINNQRPETKEKIRAYNKAWRESGREKEWQKTIPERMKQYRENHRHHEISDEEWDNCKNYFNYCCAYCGLLVEEHYNKFNGELILTDFHREHVHHDGANDLSNCIPSCKKCNITKHTTEFDEFYNKNNPNYTEERYNKIIKWLQEDHKQYIQHDKKPKRKYKIKNLNNK